MPRARVRSAPTNRIWMIEITCGTSRPAPMPCATRATMSTVAVGATPHAALAVVKTATPMR
jgi:hypothetical protein